MVLLAVNNVQWMVQVG